MSKYTTGEMAKLCGVTVRTVQYYDSRNILVPSELSEGGRRLYSEEDLQRLRIICFLREIGIPIESIRQLLNEEHPESVISVLLEQQKALLKEELTERQEKLQMVEGLQTQLKMIRHFTVDSIADIAHIMKNKKKRDRMLSRMLCVGLVMDAIEVAAIVYGIITGIWWPLLPGFAIVIVMGILIFRYYYRHTAYICPECHKTFRGTFREEFFARHTLKLRKLTCPACKHKGFCVEVYEEGDVLC